MSTQFVSRAGMVGLVTGLLGVLSAVVLLAWPPQVPPGPLSFPFTTDGFLVVQGWFFVHHFGLLAALVALARSGALGGGRVARIGAWVAVAGMVVLTGAELFAMRFAAWDAKAANEGSMGVTYGIACTVIGVGMIGAGIGVLRAGVWSGWRRWVPLAIGLSVFLVVTPGMFAGYVVARLAIGSWMALFAALGWSLLAETGRVGRALPVG
jgi:hypothetical protein